MALRMPINTNRRDSLPECKLGDFTSAPDYSLFSQFATTSTPHEIFPDPASVIEQMTH